MLEKKPIANIENDESVPYKDWKAYEEAVEQGKEEAPVDVKMRGRAEYEFNVDMALDNIDLTFNGYTPSKEAIEFFNVIRLVLGEEPEVSNSLMHYFLVDLVFDNITREQYPYSKKIRDKIRINPRKIAIIAARMSAKALSLNSKVYTPTGYTTIKNVSVGDEVLDRDGKKCNVIAKSPIFNKDTYKITLSDGRELTTSGDHDSIVWKRARQLVKGQNRCKNNRPSGMKEVVMTTAQMYNEGVTTNRTPLKEGACNSEMKFYIPVMGTQDGSIDYEASDYGFDAYTTGVILGDGSVDKATGYTRITAHKDDVLEYNRHIPYEFGKMTKKYINGEEVPAVMFGLLQQGKRIKKWIGDARSCNKRVPALLLRGSQYQRLEVLKGLMDTDGTVYENGYCSYTSVSKGLAEDVQELVRSLGGIAFITESKTSSPFGKAWSTRIKINIPIFKLKRKLSRQHIQEVDMRVGIKSIEKIDDQPTQCIAVSSPTKSFLTDGYTVTHNSTIITAYLPIYMAITGRLPNFGKIMFVVGFGDSQQGGAKVQANTIRDFCQDSPFCQDYFEKMRFTDEVCEFVRKGDAKIKDRSFMYLVRGAAGGGVRGVRYRTERPSMFIFDDIIRNEADAGSNVIMKKLHSMVYSDAEQALGRKGKIIAVNTPFNKKDVIYSALESGIWTPVCLPICEKISLDLKEDEYIGSWPQMHEYPRLLERYEDAYYGGTLREFNQELMLRISSDEDRMIKDKMIQWFSRSTIKRALGNYTILVTTDFTASSSKKGDFSGIAVWAIGVDDNKFLIDLWLKKSTIQEQYDALFGLINKWSSGGRVLEVGVEIDGQQQTNVFALEQMMLEKNYWFRFAKQKGATPTQKGIRSKAAGGNKLERLKYMMPSFEGGKMWFAEELKDTPDMKEMLEELQYVTYEAIGSKHDDACFTGNTLVCMADGSSKRIDMVKEGDLVLTSSPTSAVSKCQVAIMTGVKEVSDYRLSDGTTISMTDNHPVYTTNGWICAGNLTFKHTIIKGQTWSQNSSILSGTNGQLKKQGIINQLQKLMVKEDGCISGCGNKLMVSNLEDLKFIIRMKIKITMILVILNYSVQQHIVKSISIIRGLLNQRIPKLIKSTLIGLGLWQRNGIALVKEENGIENIEKKSKILYLQKIKNALVRTVDNLSCRALRKKMYTVIDTVKHRLIWKDIRIGCCAPAKNVEKNLDTTSTENFVAQNVSVKTIKSLNTPVKNVEKNLQTSLQLQSTVQPNVENLRIAEKIKPKTQKTLEVHPVLSVEQYLKLIENQLNSVGRSVAGVSIIEKSESRKEKTYNLEVADSHTYLVADGVIVHNCDVISQLGLIDYIIPTNEPLVVTTETSVWGTGWETVESDDKNSMMF